MLKYKRSLIFETIEDDNQWEQLILKPQLIVLDVYSEWCGPCLPMISFIKKLILELGRDNLFFAMVKSDNVTYLKRFKNKSEPTWLILSQGILVNMMFGSNGSKLTRMIKDQLKAEQEIKEGKRERLPIDMDSLPKRESRVFILPEDPEPEEQQEAVSAEEIPEKEINYYPF